MTATAVKEFLLKYSALLQNPGKSSEIFGNIKVKDKWCHVRIHCPYFPAIRDFQLIVRCGLSIKAFTDKDFDSTWTVDHVIENLSDFIQSPVGDESTTHNDRTYETLKELIPLQSSAYKIHTNQRCSIIRFSDFEGFQGHFFEIHLVDGKFVLSDHSLPDGVQWVELFQTAITVHDYLQQFLKCLEDVREFYANLSDVDELCYVVEPSDISTKHNWRIFKLTERVFVKISLDPFTCVPLQINVIGRTNQVNSLRSILSEGLKNWDSEMDVHSNLLRTFELPYFPMVNEDTEQFCNICFCYRFDGQIPIVSCDNQTCSLIYHPMCLKMWFATLAESKVFLDVAFGACPFCKEKLSTSFEDLLRQ